MFGFLPANSVVQFQACKRAVMGKKKKNNAVMRVHAVHDFHEFFHEIKRKGWNIQFVNLVTVSS